MYKRKAAYAYRRSKRARIVARAARGAITRRGLYAAGGVGVAALAGYGAYRGIRRIKRARARNQVRKQIGVSKAASCKNIIIQDISNPGSVDLTISAMNLCEIPLGGGRNERQTDTIWIKGFKLNVNMSNLAAQPVTVMMALLSPKVDYSAGVMTQFTGEFFRQNGAERAQDFLSTSSYMNLINAPINPDRWNILWKKKVELGGQRDSSFNKPISNKNTNHALQAYIKLNRKMVYESTASTSTECAPVYFVRWQVRQFQDIGGTPQATIGVQQKLVTYFSDPK